MNFPIEHDFFRLVYWLLNTAGVGGLLVTILATGMVVTIILTLRWIASGAQADEDEVYSYPTKSLIGHD